MVTLMRWIDRKFNFDFPVGMLPCIVERLRGMPFRLEEMTQSLSEEALGRHIDNGWSIKEHIGHLSDVHPLWDARLEQLLSGVDELVAADMSNRKTQEADHNARALPDLLADFGRLRLNFVARLERLSDDDAARSAMHPRLSQPMRIVDLAFFAAEHDDQHAALITQLIKALPGGTK